MGKNFNRFKHFIRSSLFLSPYVKNYILLSNARSGIHISGLIALLEIWMIVSMVIRIATSDTTFPMPWMIRHLCAYFLLLLNALLMLWYCFHFLHGDEVNKRIGKAIKIIFCIASVSFGIYISYTSINPRGQGFAFFTMELFAMCIFVWHPIGSIALLSGSFAFYLFFQNKLEPLSLSMQINSFTAWVAMVLITFNNRHQRRIQAEKDENLEKLNSYLKFKSQVDELTGVFSMTYFRKKAMEILQNEDVDISDLCFVFTNIENFANYNEKYGFSTGNIFLRRTGQIIKDIFEDDLVARFSDDHFVILCHSNDLEKKLDAAKNKILLSESFVQLAFKAGIYRPTERLTSPINACDYARYACNNVGKHFGFDIAEYDDAMAKEFRLKQYIINNIDNAVQNNLIEIYYQPVVLAENGKLCGVEALARWNDPEYGLLQPASFVPILEEYHQIHKLDMYVMENVCRDIYNAYNLGLPITPVSVNFSRLDFELFSPVAELNRCVETYGISKQDIHVEITESAIASTDTKLMEAMNAFRNCGFSLWLDDFGSGYSGLNVLKDFNFDMMKIDMLFLNKFSENSKTQPILSSIVSLADKIGMQTLTEGVETEEMREFLKSIGCQRLQGFLFGKPMPKDELMRKIQDGTYDTSVLAVRKRGDKGQIG